GYEGPGNLRHRHRPADFERRAQGKAAGEEPATSPGARLRQIRPGPDLAHPRGCQQGGRQTGKRHSHLEAAQARSGQAAEDRREEIEKKTRNQSRLGLVFKKSIQTLNENTSKSKKGDKPMAEKPDLATKSPAAPAGTETTYGGNQFVPRVDIIETDKQL